MRYQRDPDWAFKSVLDDTAGVLVPLVSSQADLTALFQLNSTGAYLWTLLDRPRSEEELLTALGAAFDTESTPEDQLRRDLDQHLGEMLAIGALRKA